MLNWIKDCYENDSERLGKQARDKCTHLSEEEKMKWDNMG